VLVGAAIMLPLSRALAVVFVAKLVPKEIAKLAIPLVLKSGRFTPLKQRLTKSVSTTNTKLEEDSDRTINH